MARQPPVRALVEEERNRLLARLEELRPAMNEAQRILRQLRALQRVEDSPVTTEQSASRSPGRQRLSPEFRKAQVIELTTGSELSRSQIANALGISRPHAGRILKALLMEDKVVHRGDGRFSAAEGVYRRRLPAHARLQQVVDLVRRSPGMRRKEVALAIGISQARAGQLVNELIKADRLVDDGRGHLTVAEGIGP